MRHRRRHQVSIVVQFGRLETFTTLLVSLDTDLMYTIYLDMHSEIALNLDKPRHFTVQMFRMISE